MKTFLMIIAMGLAVMLSGCTTANQVQQMIDASHQNYQSQLQAQQESIDVLKKSAMTSLETGVDNSDRLAEIERQIDNMITQMIIVQDLANASKVISAANTVKVADLEDRVSSHIESNAKDIARMSDLDRLYENVLIRQFRAISASANAAIDALNAKGYSATTNVPINLDEPMVITAPDTAPMIPTNESSAAQ